MIKIQYDKIKHAIKIVTESNSKDLYIWLRDNCKEPVFCDIYLKDLFSYSSQDAMMFKLACGGSPFGPEDWTWVFDMTKYEETPKISDPRYYLANWMPDDSILVDNRVAHVR